MKDAKGHGSDAKGKVAHQTGINKVGYGPSQDELDSAALKDLLSDAKSAEEQAKTGPFYVDGPAPYRDRVLTTDPGQIQAAKQELLAYAAKCRAQAASYSQGGAHKAVLSGKS
jgi:hypothetical protein